MNIEKIAYQLELVQPLPKICNLNILLLKCPFNLKISLKIAWFNLFAIFFENYCNLISPKQESFRLQYIIKHLY